MAHSKDASKPSAWERENEEDLAKLRKRYAAIEPTLGRYQDQLEREFRSFFRYAEAQDSYTTYGVADISVRRKSIRSIIDGLKNDSESGEPDKAARSADRLRTLLGNGAYQREDEEPLVSEWCKEIEDLLGIRIIVQAQRNKYQIYRAMQYLCDINATDQQYLHAIGIPQVSHSTERPWKYFNPPAMRAHYRPYLVSEFLNTIQDISKYATRSNMDDELGQAISRLRGLASRTQVGFEFKPSGYATIQRNVLVRFERVPITVEVQVRTTLEHAWAEPQHKLSYKGKPLSEEVNGYFRSFGASLAAADDLLQIALDKYHIQQNNPADFSERSLKPHEITHLDKDDDKIFRIDLEQIYAYIRLGYFGDAITLASLARKQYKRNPVHWAILSIEEAICHLHNLSITVDAVDDDTGRNETGYGKVVKLLEDVTESKLDIGDYYRIWAYLRLAQCRLLITEHRYVAYKRRTYNSLPEKHTQSIKPYLKDIDEAYRIIRDVLPGLLKKNELLLNPSAKLKTESFPAGFQSEVMLLAARVWRWKWDLRLIFRHEDTDSQPWQDEESFLTSAMHCADWAVYRLGSGGVIKREHVEGRARARPWNRAQDMADVNDVDLEALNAAIWARRRLHAAMFPAENRLEKTIPATIQDEDSDPFHKLVDECDELFERLRGVLNGRGDERRKNLGNAIDFVAQGGQMNERFGQYVSKCHIHDLKIIDTVIGLQSMKRRRNIVRQTIKPAKDAEMKAFLNDCNAHVAEALVRIAANGDFAFDSLFAFNLLSKERFG